MLTSAPNLVSSHDQLPVLGFSNDDLVYSSYALKQIRSFQYTDEDEWWKIHADAAKLDWMSIAAATNVNNKVSCALSTFVTCIFQKALFLNIVN